MRDGGKDGNLLLGVDTCGATGSVALGRVLGDGIEVVGERMIAGGELSVSLISGVADLLDAAGIAIADLAGIVVVPGPGTFTGIRIGLAAVKGLAEAAGLPVVTVSRLRLLAELAQAPSSVLDAHRGQVFCGFYADEPREVLMTAGEVNAMGGFAGRVGVCESSVAQWIEELVGEPEVVQVASPTAADVLRAGLASWRAGTFADLATLDGYYLRGADAKLAAGRS